MSKKIKILLIISFFSYFLFFGQVSAADTVNPIYSMAVSGNVKLDKSDSYARIILTDTSGNEYLIYEAQGPFDSGSFSFENTCEETCVLNGIVPKKVDVEVSNATITISQIITLEDKEGLNQQVRTMGIKSYSSDLSESQEQVKIDKINQYIKDNNLAWTAGKTSVSGYSYEQKKNLFGLIIDSSDEEIPNTQGFEYYTGGVFEMTGTGISPRSVSSSNLPSSFDWSNRHGENWLTPVKSQGQCGSCWAFAPTGAVEAVTNLYFNQHLDIDLSEQQVVSCMPDWRRILGRVGCNGGFPDNALNYYKNTGVTTEDCFPYLAKDLPCENKCNNWKNSIIKTGGLKRHADPLTDDGLKRMIIKNGPLSVGVENQRHVMALIGWETGPKDNQTVWIFKNSWGNWWGEQGYTKLKTPITNIDKATFGVRPPITIANKTKLQISCTDKDNDNYCNWGISETKPSNCPSSCKSEKDCDDSNPYLGPSDANFNCISISPATSDTTRPSIGKIQTTIVKAGVEQNFSTSVSDNKEVVKCNLFIQNQDKGPMKLSTSPCRSCTVSKAHAFAVGGDYSLYVKCWDEEGNMGSGSSVNIKVSTACPNCQSNGTDLCENPPRCEKDCGISAKCDEKEPNSYWAEGDVCNLCNSTCHLFSFLSKPSPYYFSNNTCHYNCSVECSSWNWKRKNCSSMVCPEIKISGRTCYYNRRCTSGGCTYSNLDSTNKKCDKSVCTTSGWDNSKCSTPSPTPTPTPTPGPGPAPIGAWTPCDPISGWKCDKKSNGNASCEGQHIGWGWGDDGEVVCPEGTIVTEGLCKGKNDDSVKKQEVRVNMVPSPATFSNTTTFVPQSSWYCKFSCSGLFCGADGCAWANCEAGNQSIDKIEVKIYNLSGSLVYNKTVSSQGSISWNGKNNQGQQLANGIYVYQTKVYLKNNKNYTTGDRIKIQR